MPVTGHADTVIVVPILERAHRVGPVVESIRATCDARIMFVCTPTDRAVIDVINTVRGLSEYMTIPFHPIGDYARKINAGIRATTEPLIFMGADDLDFQPGWLDAAKAKLGPGIGVVGTNDMANPRVIAGAHSTHSLVTRQYVDEHGTVDGPGAALYDGYPHEFCDDELVGTAKARGAYAHAGDAIVRHRHPNFDASVPMDALYAGQAHRMAAGRRIYHQRRRRWERAWT